MTDFRALCAELVDAYAWCVDNYMTASADEDSLIDRARAALAKPEPQGPGRPAIKPVPVAERLPTEADCDAEGRCWLTSVDVEPGWVTDNPEQCTNWTHWLPYHALPVPQLEADHD